jgi:hypothetical protein
LCTIQPFSHVAAPNVQRTVRGHLRSFPGHLNFAMYSTRRKRKEREYVGVVPYHTYHLSLEMVFMIHMDVYVWHGILFSRVPVGVSGVPTSASIFTLHTFSTALSVKNLGPRRYLLCSTQKDPSFEVRAHVFRSRAKRRRRCVVRRTKSTR